RKLSQGSPLRRASPPYRPPGCRLGAGLVPTDLIQHSASPITNLEHPSALSLSISRPLPACQSIQVFGIPSPVHFDRRGGIIDRTQVVRCECDFHRPVVFIKAMWFRRTWNGNNPRLPSKEPGERDLSRCGLLPFCDASNEIHESFIGFSSLGRETR